MRALYNRPALLLSLTALFWAGNFVVGRAVAFSIPPVTLTVLRWAIAFLILLPFAWPHLRRDGAVLRQHWKIVLFLALLGPASYNTLTYIGLAYTEALNGLVFNAAGPMFIAVAAYLFFGDRLTGRQAAGLLAGIAGVLLVLTQGRPSALAGLTLNPGDLLMVAAITAWGIYTAFLRKRPPVAWQSFNAVMFAIAALANMPLALNELAAGREVALTLPNIAAIGDVAVFPSLIAYIFYNRGVELIGAAKSGMFLFLMPVFGAVLATLFLGETLYAFHIVAFTLIIAGVTAATASPSVSRPASG